MIVIREFDMELFLDLDGVLADFDKHYYNLFGYKPIKNTKNKQEKVNWKLIEKADRFFYNLPLMEDALELWDYCKKYNPIIITGLPTSVESAAKDKIEYVKDNLNYDKIICCKAKNKCLYGNSGDILIDDTKKYMLDWINMGGIWITHASAENSINELKKQGF